MVRIFLGGDQMVFQESETVELKSVVADDIKKETVKAENCILASKTTEQWLG